MRGYPPWARPDAGGRPGTADVDARARAAWAESGSRRSRSAWRAGRPAQDRPALRAGPPLGLGGGLADVSGPSARSVCGARAARFRFGAWGSALSEPVRRVVCAAVWRMDQGRRAASVCRRPGEPFLFRGGGGVDSRRRRRPQSLQSLRPRTIRPAPGTSSRYPEQPTGRGAKPQFPRRTPANFIAPWAPSSSRGLCLRTCFHRISKSRATPAATVYPGLSRGTVSIDAVDTDSACKPL